MAEYKGRKRGPKAFEFTEEVYQKIEELALHRDAPDDLLGKEIQIGEIAGICKKGPGAGTQDRHFLLDGSG